MPEKIRLWRERVIEWTSDVNGEPFEWGKTDCASLIRRVCKIVYGEDVFSHLNRYTTLREAKEEWDRTGGTAEQLKKIGAEEIDINFAQRCDIIITSEDEFDFYAAMINIPKGYLASSKEHGVVILDKRLVDNDILYALRLPDTVDTE